MARLACLALLASVVAGVAIAQQPAPGASSALSAQTLASSSQPPADPIVCETEKEVGSMFSHQVCHPKSVWAQISRDSQDYVHDSMTNSTHGRPPGN